MAYNWLDHPIVSPIFANWGKIDGLKMGQGSSNFCLSFWPIFPVLDGVTEDPSSLRAAIATLGAAAQWQRALGLFRGHALDVYAGG